MAGPIDLKFSGAILGSTGLLTRVLPEMCIIPFNFHFEDKMTDIQRKVLQRNWKLLLDDLRVDEIIAHHIQVKDS